MIRCEYPFIKEDMSALCSNPATKCFRISWPTGVMLYFRCQVHPVVGAGIVEVDVNDGIVEVILSS